MDQYQDESVSSVNQSTKGKDTALPAYIYAKTLTLAARSAFQSRTKSFQSNWDYLVGRNHWRSAASTAARQIDAWSFKGVVNWTYATIKTKTSIILSSQSETYVDALDENSTYYDRLLVKSAVDHLLKSVRFHDVKRDALLSGSVTGVGISMWQYRPDPITGAMKLFLVPIKSEEFTPDPSADLITSPDCRYVVWSTDMDMSRVREIFLGKAKEVKPDPSNASEPSGITYTMPGDSNLIFGPGQSIKEPSPNAARRKAKVNFVWVKDESMIEELSEVLVAEEEPGVWCPTCAQAYAISALDGPMDNCPICQSPMENVTVPPKMRTDRTIRRAYPYGRLIVYSGDILLFDGQNPYEIESVFPFAVYHHDRIPGDFYGQNDVSLLQSLQEAENTVLSMGVDGVVMSMFGPFEYPIGAKSYTELGNGPKERHPVPDHLAGKARFVPSVGADMNLWHGVLANIEHQFQTVSGLAQLGLGQTSSPPISATEAEIANARLSDRMKAHAREFSAYCSEVQFYDEAATTPVTFPDSSVKDIAIEWQKLPNVRVQVSVNTEESIRDKQVGQNITIGIQNGILDSPYAKLYLEMVGANPSQIKEVLDNKALAVELGAQQMPGGEMPPPDSLQLVEGGQNAANP
jgi:hypothetical protein